MGRPDFTLLEKPFLEGFDVHLQEFYKGVIDMEIDFKSHVEEIKDNIKEIILHYKKDVEDKHSIDLRFSTEVRRCAYVLKNSALFTHTVAFHFSRLILQNKTMLMKPFRRRKLHLCCLGGGPAPEMVGIVKVLGLVYSSTLNQELLDLKVTIIDIELGWKTTCENVLKRLVEDETFEGVDRIRIDLEFVQADLTKPTTDVKNLIERADIVTMVFFLSTINGGKYTEESFEMVRNIMEVIKPEGVLFFLNNATDVHFEQMYKAAILVADMEIIYQPCVEELRNLNPKSVEKFLEIYEGLFNLRNCMTHGFMSYCVWRRKGSYLDIDEKEEEKRKDTLKSQKNNEYLTIKMKKYRRLMFDLSKKWGKHDDKSSEHAGGTGRDNSPHSNDVTADTLNNQNTVIDNDNNIEPEIENSGNIENDENKQQSTNVFTVEGERGDFSERNESFEITASDLQNVTISESSRKHESFEGKEEDGRNTNISIESGKVHSQPECKNISGNEEREYSKKDPTNEDEVKEEIKRKANILRRPHFKSNIITYDENKDSLTDEEKMNKLKLDSKTTSVKDGKNDGIGKKTTVSVKGEDSVRMPWIPEVKPLRKPFSKPDEI